MQCQLLLNYLDLEYGSSVLDRPGEFIHRYRDGVEEDYPWRSGKCLWCAFHHGSILGNMGHMGMIDYYRLPLDTWYWYRENLAGVPRPEIPKKGVPHRVRLTPSSLTMKCDGTEDVKIVAEVLNEAGERIDCNPQIELTVVSGPGRFPTGKNFILSSGKENLIQGLGAITLRAYDGGETVVHAVCEGLLCDEIRIQVLGEEAPEGCARVELQPPPYVCDELKDVHNPAEKYLPETPRLTGLALLHKKRPYDLQEFVSLQSRPLFFSRHLSDPDHPVLMTFHWKHAHRRIRQDGAIQHPAPDVFSPSAIGVVPLRPHYQYAAPELFGDLAHFSKDRKAHPSGLDSLLRAGWSAVLEPAPVPVFQGRHYPPHGCYRSNP